MTMTSEENTNSNAIPNPEAQITYQKNWEYEQSIKKEEAGKIPLICLEEDIKSLYSEYENGSETYRSKIKKLAEKHSKIRRCRGDGNCFYRAFGFAWFERLMMCNNQNLRQAALKSFADTKDLLKSMGYELFVYEVSYEEVEDRLKAVCNGEHVGETLLSIFQNDEVSNHIVWYLRAITAAYLKKHREEYEPFIEYGLEMDQYCANCVEVMAQEADHIHVIALTKALKVPVEIAYMSGSEILDEEPLTLKPLVLLYRPGHYDILYRNEF
ncbi:8128_t:CDS:2 [Entrophospora sp. SA101]|nr:13008_t:CDS:2 [Entrophospora sp. SA101]CAJ0646027.1 8128_t:CDS:2 [Entrophospora sp. SA101]CAJ0831598.1 13150_t:CDS:2 [Entrophospora sp. SA101]CAJ0840092.1 7249_t:CDS:2 [Entrophospora sp. SA101]CAJ0910315.1 10252_t:CDS:2 [Entrophospora sp. SA101]